MFRSTGAVLAALTLAGSVAVTSPAHAEHLVVVNGCETTAAPSTRATCVFVGLPGNYRVELITDVRYAWAQVNCVNQTQQLFVDAWDTDGYADNRVGYLGGGVCTMVVAAGTTVPGNPGQFGAHAHVYLL